MFASSQRFQVWFQGFKGMRVAILGVPETTAKVETTATTGPLQPARHHRLADHMFHEPAPTARGIWRCDAVDADRAGAD